MAVMSTSSEDVAQGPQIPTTTEPYAFIIQNAIREFLRRTGQNATLPPTMHDPTLAQAVRERIAAMDHGLHPKRVEAYISTALAFTVYGFPYITRLDLRIAITIYTFCCLGGDDSCASSVEGGRAVAHEEFAERLLGVAPQRTPILQRLAESVKETMQFYGSFSGAVFATNTIEFISAQAFVDHHVVELPVVMPSSGNGDAENATMAGKAVKASTEYLDYMRWKHGIGESFTALVWPKDLFPDTKSFVTCLSAAVEFIYLHNDLFSHYKERKHNEQGTYITTLTALNSKYGATSLYASTDKTDVLLLETERNTLVSIVDRLVDRFEAVKILLGGNGPCPSPAWLAWESFAVGFTKAHFVEKRYLLDEILPEYC